MKIVDTTPGHRAITLKSTEKLTSQRFIAALVRHGLHNPSEAENLVGHVFDALEESTV